ncbi:type-F conjugative transfer system pilin assembly protein TrbC [Klebsiella pneumoniae]
MASQQKAANQEKPAEETLYFVSFSIPEEGLKRMLHETRQYGIPATLRGLINNDMRTTTDAVLQLVKDGVTDGVDRPDTVHAVRHPECAVSGGTVSGRYDVVRGNIHVKQALEKVAQTGDCAQVARQMLDAPSNAAGSQPLAKDKPYFMALPEMVRDAGGGNEDGYFRADRAFFCPGYLHLAGIPRLR